MLGVSRREGYTYYCCNQSQTTKTSSSPSLTNMAALPSDFQFEMSPFSGLIEDTEFYFRKLYLRQIFSGPNKNQSQIVAGDAATDFGTTAVNNWAIFDGMGKKAKLVGRAKGVHMNTVNWYNSFTIVFEIERFKGFTLDVTGVSIENEGEWSIVGGTGKFSFARGVIKRNVPVPAQNEDLPTDDGVQQELTFHGYCGSRKGPWGGEGGVAHDVSAKPWRLQSVTAGFGGVVHSLQFSYIDQDGKSRTDGHWGPTPLPHEKVQAIKLEPSEFVKEVFGSVYFFEGRNVIGKLTIVTSSNKTVTFGTWGDTTFRFSPPPGRRIVGFYAKASNVLDSVGIYTV